MSAENQGYYNALSRHEIRIVCIVHSTQDTSTKEHKTPFTLFIHKMPDPIVDTILEYLLWMCWMYLTQVSTNFKNPTHDFIFTSKAVMQGFMAVITFADPLLDILLAATSPTLAVLKSLPGPLKGCWGVYLIVLEKKGCRFKIYIGTGTGTKSNMHQRMANYYVGSIYMPLRVTQAMKDGYSITHKGVLCWASVPGPASRVPLRALFLILETVLYFSLGAMQNRESAYGGPHILPWDAQDIEYDGCCTHPAIWESIEGEEAGLTLEQLAEKQVQMDIRRKERQKYWSAKTVVKRNSSELLTQRALAATRRCMDKKRQEKKHHCTLCDMSFGSGTHLARHEKSEMHIAVISGTFKKRCTPAQLAIARACRDRKVALKTHYCKPCKKPFPTASGLARHKTTESHKNQLAKNAL
jgi:hypothetical protein